MAKIYELSNNNKIFQKVVYSKMIVIIEQVVGVAFKVEVEKDTTVWELKEKVDDVIGIHGTLQELIFQCEVMVNSKVLGDYSIKEGSVIMVTTKGPIRRT